jgi:acyl-CoA hydrolase
VSQLFSSSERCVDEILARTGKRIVLGIPLGIGKPNALVNALYERACKDRALSLEIITALSLNPPRGTSELEERFLKPIRARVWKDYPRLAYLDDREAESLPDNVRVHEFYMRSGSGLGSDYAQRHYISSNYTHVARDMLSRGVNLVMQAVATRPAQDGAAKDAAENARYSLSSNPDVTLQLLPLLKESGRPCLLVGQVNRRLPWFGRAAELTADAFDLLLDQPTLDHEPFSVPHEPVDLVSWAIGLHGSALVKDGGTLQVGIGALGDAVCHALRLRDKQNADYVGLLRGLGAQASGSRIGGEEPFREGLYVASELISNPLFALFEAGIVRRRVSEDPAEERARAQVEARGSAREPSGDAPSQHGTALQGAFFIGPNDFYERLRNLSDSQRELVDMTSVAEVNRVYQAFELERLQRRHARFLNITMKATLLGSAVSDQLENGAVVSGVGGQNEFVMMAHQLPEARSVLLFRSTYKKGKQLCSNVHWEYPHCTIPRHMRDIFVTEYGIADLRGKTDQECVAAMLAISDSRFQDELCQQAKRGKKLPKDYVLPTAVRDNTPERLAKALSPAQHAGLLPRLPFGCDLTDAELRLAARLKTLGAAVASWEGRAKLLAAVSKQLTSGKREGAEDLQFALAHLGLTRPNGPKEQLLAQMVRAAHGL